MPSRRGALLETVHHDGFDIELVGAALGVVAFVFEGRPNVLADACGVLRGGNAVVFRIGSDALATARAIMRLAIEPALLAAGLPAGAVALVDSTAHAAGWALFADARLALAVRALAPARRWRPWAPSLEPPARRSVCMAPAALGWWFPNTRTTPICAKRCSARSIARCAIR